MKNRKGFTLLEVLLALGIISIAMVFLINGIYNIEELSNENKNSLEMYKALQSNMEMVLSDKEIIIPHSYIFDGYYVEIFLEPHQNTNLVTLQLIITSSSGKRIKAGVIYNRENY